MLSTKTRIRRRKDRPTRRGVALVEMAFVLPVFVILLFGFIEMSRLYFAVSSTQVALIKSARSLSLPDATAQNGESAVLDYLTRLGYSDNQINVVVTPSAIAPTTREVKVEVELDMQPIPYTIRKSIVRSRE